MREKISYSKQTALKSKTQSDGRQKSLAEMVQQLNYPTIKDNCFICTLSISSNSTKTCLDCQRRFHSECMVKIGSQYQLQNHSHGNEIMQCAFCYRKETCMSCRNYWKEFDSRYTCSICFLSIHVACWNVPTWVTEADEQPRRQYNVCKSCILQWGVKTTLQTVKGKQLNQCFMRVLINHPSPIHYTWISIEDYKSVKVEDEELEVIPNEASIELLLSVQVPLRYSTLQPLEVVRLLSSSSRLVKPGVDSFKFLIKWKCWSGLSTWEEEWVVRHWGGSLANFVHLIHMRYIECLELPHRIVMNHLAECIAQFMAQGNISAEMRYIDSKAGVGEVDIADQCQKIFKLYSQNSAQSIKTASQNDDLKAEAVCRLINTIYFVSKNSSPIMLLTYQSALRWWSIRLKKNSPFLTTMCIGNSSPETTDLVCRHFMKHKNQQLLFKFNVLLLAYEQVQSMAFHLDLKQVMDCCSLVVFDEKMSPIARCYYSQTVTPRIKLLRSINTVSKDAHKTGMEVTDASTLHSRSIESSLGGKASLSEAQLMISIRSQQQQGQFKQPPSQIASPPKQHLVSKPQQHDKYTLIWRQLMASFGRDGQKFKRQLSETKRLVFLRFIIAFGMNFSNSSECLAALAEYDATVFGQSKDRESLIVLLNVHICGFMAAVHIFSSKRVEQTEEELLAHFCFDIPPKHIIRQITSLAKLRRYLQVYGERPEECKLAIEPTLFFQSKSGVIRNWQWKIDSEICELVLLLGWGQWEGMSDYRRSWMGDREMSFREYFCFKLNGISVKTSLFEKFIKTRVEDIVDFSSCKFE